MYRRTILQFRTRTESHLSCLTFDVFVDWLDMNRWNSVSCILLFHLYCSLDVCEAFLNVQHLSKVSSVRSLRHHPNSLVATISRRDLMISSSVLSSSLAMKKDDKEIGWGIVGLGDVCAVKAGPAFVKCDGSRLVAVMRRTPGAAAQWMKDHASFVPTDCRPYDDLDQFLNDPELDAVYIATPPESHVQVAEKVAQAGKIAYIEKPVGRCAAETQAIINAFQTKNNLPLFTAYTSRAFDRTKLIQQLLKDGVIGDKVTHISYKLTGSSVVRGLEDTSSSLPWRMDAAKSGGGLIMDVGCHLLDRLDYLFGPLIHVHGEAITKSKSSKVEDYVNIHASIGSKVTTLYDDPIIKSEGASVNCTWDFASEEDDPVDELRIIGSNGKSLQMAGQSPSAPIYVMDANNDTIEQEITSFHVPNHTTQPLLQMIVNELRGKEGKSPSRTDNALRTSQVLDTALSSFYGNRDIGFWDHPETWPGLSKSTVPK